MNPLRTLLLPSAALGLLALGAKAPAQTQGYVQKTKNVRAAVLLLDSDRPSTKLYSQTAAPFAFYNLDAVPGAKPDGWNFVNPYAAGVVNLEMRRRYAEIYNQNVANPPAYNANTFPVPPEGTVLTKRNGPYWTVELSKLSETQISSYDVLLVAPKYALQLNATERDRLRRFVDGGGVLWVDLLAAQAASNAGYVYFDPMNNLPLSLQPRLGVGNAAAYRDASSPVLNGPRTVSDADLYYLNDASLGLPQNGLEPVPFPVTANPNFPASNFIPINAEFARYRSVASVGAGFPVITEARLGDGAIVVTARGAAEMLNRATAPQLLDYSNAPAAVSNVGFVSRNAALDPQGRAAARLAVNIASLGANYRQQGGGSRKQGSSTADPGSPVLPRFDTEQPPGSLDPGYGPNGIITYPSAPNGAPVTFKGYLVETVGNRVVVFDAVPGRDLDGDGDPDDGIVTTGGVVDNALRDVSVGKPLDVVWVSDDAGSRLSAPVCAEVPEAGGTSMDQILATDAQGNLHTWKLSVPVSASNPQIVGGFHGQLFAPIAPPTGTSSDLLPPTVYDGLAYMADTSMNAGRLWVVDLSTGARLNGGANDWYVAGGGLPFFSAPPTIGYIPATDSPGGADRVLYAPGVFGAATNPKPGFVSVWLGAKGETPQSLVFDGVNLRITTRAGASGGLPVFVPGPGGSPVLSQLAPRLTLLKSNQDPMTAAEMQAYVVGNARNAGDGVVEFTLAPGMDETRFNNDGVGVRIDYTVDWGFSPTTINAQMVRGQLVLPTLQNGNNPNKAILGSIALTSRGTLHMVEGPRNTATANDGGDSYWAIREDGGLRGQFRVVSRYTLHRAYTQTFGGVGVGTPVPAVLGDADAIQGFLPGYTNDPGAPINTFTNWHFAGGVAVRNGIAYVAINAVRANFLPVTMVAAFQAEPETAELRVGNAIGDKPSIVQTDFARSRAESVLGTTTNSTLQGNQIVVDADNGVIRIENLATVVRGEIVDCLSRSQPIGLNLNGTVSYRDPDAEGDRWSPLLWFGLWNGGVATGTPLVAGNEVFLPAQSSLPSLLSNGTFDPSGVVWSVDADAPATGPYTVTLPDRPWLVQQAQIVTTTGFAASPYFRMPQNRGVRDFADYVLRLNQTKLGTSTTVRGLSGGDGVVSGYTDKGVYGLSRADFLVCDEGRLLRVDSAGNPIANVFGSRFTGVGNGGTAAELRPLVRPVRAYPVGVQETLVVDAGANRVMILDDDGNALRSLDRITLDPNHKPANYRVNEPLEFKEPRDATTFEGYVYKGAQDEVTDQRNVEYWKRYLVADAGNGRLVELADRFEVDPATGRVGAPVQLDNVPDPATGVVRPGLLTPQVGVLVWQSPALARNVGTYFNSVSRIFVGGLGTGRYAYVAGVSRGRPTRSSAGLDNPNGGPVASSGGGAVVVFDTLGGTRVFDRFTIPNRTGVPYLAIPAGSTNPPAVGQPFQTNPLLVGQDDRPFAGVNSVTARTVVLGNTGETGVRVMVADTDAVYEFELTSASIANPTGSGTLGAPNWMIDERAFTALRPSPSSTAATLPTNSPLRVAYSSNARFFRPAFARRLDSGDVLIVNGYRGVRRDGLTEYAGEVSLLDGAAYTLAGNQNSNLGFDLGDLRFELPPLTGIRGIVSPVFADRR